MRSLCFLVFVLAAAVIPVAALAAPSGRSTLDTGIGLENRAGLREPVEAPGRPYTVRSPHGMDAIARAGSRRRSLAFFAHLTDAQLADEMSPARIEYQRAGGKFLGAWRPHEALGPQTFDQAVRNVNLNRVSRTADGQGRRAALDFALVTGDLSDNHQRNEVRWGVRILEGGPVDPFSGARVGPGNRCPGASAAVRRRLNAAVARRAYTGVQDADDYPGRPADVYGRFYDPDATPPPGSPYAALPRHPGLLERAQSPFRAEGLRMPWFAARGNHDAAAQGFFTGRAGASTAVGCRKVMPARRLGAIGSLGHPWDAMRARLRRPGRFSWVPPDPARRFVSARSFKRLHGRADRGHGFAFTARAQRRASAGAASYYSWAPKPGLRFVSLDTVAEGGGHDGNLDHAQYRWLKRVLAQAGRRNELVVVYGHHSLETMANDRNDEFAGPCGRGWLACDADPRRSTPLHFGRGGRASVRSLLLASPNVVLYVTGHVHRNRVTPHFRARGGSGFWQVTTASHLSYPQQTRLVELMDNGNGTLSIVNTVLDTAAPVQPPARGTPGAAMDEAGLASLSRLLAANVRGARAPPAVAAGAASASAFPAGNVELRLADPR